MANNFGWGIIGLGNIAQKFAKDLALVPNAALMAVASRSLQKALHFKAEFKVPYAYDNYKALFLCEEVEVVYIALPHTEHYTWSIMAMEHGKHVLCEKPMGVNKTQVEEMIRVSREKNVFLMEALWSRFIPAIQEAKKIIEAGEIGKIGCLNADFAFYALNRDQDGRLLNPALAGGSLLDIGIYPVFLAYLILGKPESIQTSAKFLDSGTEYQISMLFKYPSADAVLFSSLNCNSPMSATISGSDGSLVLYPRWHESEGFSLTRDGQTEEFEFPKVGKGYTYEIEEVHQCLIEKKLESSQWSHKNSLELISLLDQIREKSGISFPFEG